MSPEKPVTPDLRPITRRQAQRLARVARVPAESLEGVRVAELEERLRWRIDPNLLLFRRICGKVVKQDPLTGALQPVPNATVHVLDTDCSFVGFFPGGSPWFWLWPFACTTEELATVTTDACGRFCVWIPAFDVDHYLRFRLERVCFPEIVKPTLRDVLERLEYDPPLTRPPRPEPDPGPLVVDRLRLEHLTQLLGPDAVHSLAEAAAPSVLGDRIPSEQAGLDRPAFLRRLPPPLTGEMRGALADESSAGIEHVADSLRAEPALFKRLSPERYIGPFLRCRWVIVPEWTTLLDVPDITFRVTQDIDGDGVEEEIYTEGFFDVRWNAGAIPDVTLVASPGAISVPHCEPVEGIECQNTPAIVTAGYMPLLATHHDDTTGLATRVNRPRPPDGHYGTPQSSPGFAPYTRTLNLHGCQRIGGASHYRLTYAFNGGAQVPFTGLAWWAPRLGPGAPIHVVPDGDGWYPVLPVAQLAHPTWLLSWPTHAYGDGSYELRLELGAAAGGSIAVTDTSSPRTFLIDNSRPDVQFHEIRWRAATVPLATPWTDANSVLLPDICPVLTRPAGTDVHLRVVWSASADHLRNAQLGAGGCGAGGFSFVTGEESFRHWHIDAANNAVLRTAVLLLPGGRPPGCYHLRVDGWGRQFNPSGFDAGPSANWYINQGTFSWSQVTRSISLVNA